MDINEIRKTNYQALLRMFRERPEEQGLPHHGMGKRFAAAGGLSAAYLSHLNHDRKQIGDDLARRMEVAFGMAHGWMDRDHELDYGELTPEEREHLMLSLKLFREAPVAAQAVLMKYMMDRLEKGKPP